MAIKKPTKDKKAPVKGVKSETASNKVLPFKKGGMARGKKGC